MAGEGGESVGRAGVGVARPAAVQAAQGGPAGLAGTEVVGGARTAGGGDQQDLRAVGAVLGSPGRVEGAVPGRQPVLWQGFTLDRGPPRPPVATRAPAGLAPVVPVQPRPLALHTVDALEGDVEPLGETREATVTVHSTHSESSLVPILVPGNCGRRNLLRAQVKF